MINLLEKCHMPRSIFPLLIAIKLKTKCYIRAVRHVVVFPFYKELSK